MIGLANSLLVQDPIYLRQTGSWCYVLVPLLVILNPP